MAASASLKLQYPLSRNICQIHCVYTIHDCKSSSKINTVPINECMATNTFVKQRNTVLLKNIFPVNTRSKLQRKNVLLGTTTSDHSYFS